MINFFRIHGIFKKCETKAFLCKAYILPKNRVGTYKRQSALIRDNWYFLKKISVPY